MIKKITQNFSWRQPLGVKHGPQGQWLFVGLLVLLLGINGVEAVNNAFESTAFPSFRYEAKLFVYNAFLYLSEAPFLSLFFFSDLSTSFDSAQHPLYYFHNINAIHFIAGLVQYYTDNWGYVLFTAAAVLFIVASVMLFDMDRREHEKLFHFALIATILLSPKGLLWIPQNFFIAVVVFGVVAHFVLLRRIVSTSPSLKNGIYLFAVATLMTAAETNSAVLLCLISILYAFISALSSLVARKKIIPIILQAIYAPLLSGMPIIISRIGQFWAINVNNLRNLYILDLEFTRELKVDGGITLAKAIEFYAQNGLTFFGIVGNNDLLENIKFLFAYYTDEFSPLFFPVILALALVTVLALHRQYVLQQPSLKQSSHEDTQKQTSTAPDLLAYLAAYIFCFVFATFAILYLSGRSLNNVGLSDWAIFDIAVVFRACYFVFPALLIAAVLRHRRVFEKGLLEKAKNSVLLAVVFAGAIGADFLYVRADPLTFKDALGAVPPQSDIITNFDIAPLAIETQSRISISWFVQPTPDCNIQKSDALLRMYRVTPQSEAGSGDIYFMLAFFQPYGPSREAIVSRHCLNQVPHSILYEDGDYGLYKITKRP